MRPNLRTAGTFMKRQALTTGRVVVFALTAATVAAAVRRRADLGRGTVRVLMHLLYALYVRIGLGATTVTYDPEALSLRRVVLVSNHVSVADWLILWLVLERIGHRRIVFCAKRLRGVLVPINVIMRMLGFVVLVQDLDQDYIALTACARRLAKEEDYCVILFPEGRLRDTLVRRRAPADPPVPPTLPIKTRAFCIFAKNLGDSLQGVLDCTLVYENPEGSMVRPGDSRLVLRPLAIPDARDDAAWDNWLRHLFSEVKPATLEDVRQAAARSRRTGNKIELAEIEYPRSLAFRPWGIRLIRLLTGRRSILIWVLTAIFAKLVRLRDTEVTGRISTKV